MAGKGRNILVEVYTGSGYEVIGLMQSKTLTINSASIDQTDVDSGDWKVLDDRGLGDKSLSLSGAGILDTTNSPLVFVEDAVWSGELVTIRITFENGDYYISNFKIVTFDRSGELNGIVPFSFSAESTAAPTNSGVGAVGGAYWDASGGAAILGRYVPPVGCSIEELVYGSISQTVFFGAGTAEDVSFSADGTKMYTLGNSADDRVHQYALNTAWDISAGFVYVDNVDIAADFVLPYGFTFSTDGTKMYVIGAATGDKVKQYTLSTAWDITTASYDSVFYDLSGVGSGFNFGAIRFKTDGTVMYCQKGGNEEVYQLNLNTAWDLSDTVTPNGFYSLESRDTNIEGIHISGDGSVMIVIGDTNNNAYQYTLNTPWDVTSAVYVRTFALQHTNMRGLCMSSDGTKMYVQLGSWVAYYTLSSAWDLSTAVYDSAPAIQYGDANQIDLDFSVDGSYMYTLAGGRCYQWILSSPWSLGGAEASEANLGMFDPSEGGTHAFQFKPDGLTLPFLVDSGFYSYTLSVAWDISSAVYNGFLSNPTEDNLFTNFFVRPDGLKVYMVGSQNNAVYQYSLSSAWDLSTISYDSVSFDISAESTTPVDIRFGVAGVFMYIVDYSSGAIYRYSLSTPWDLSTAVYDSVVLDVSNEDINPASIYIKDCETVFMLGDDTDTVYEYTISEVPSISTGLFSASYTGEYFLTSIWADGDIVFKPDGLKLYVFGYTDGTFLGTVAEYDLSVAWDLSTASPTPTNTFDVTSEENWPTGGSFNSDGTKMYISSTNIGNIFEYDLGTAWDVSSAVYNAVNLDTQAQDDQPLGHVWNADGTKFFFVGRRNDRMYEYAVSTPWDISSATFTAQTSFTIPGSLWGLAISSDGLFAYVQHSGGTTWRYDFGTAYDITTLTDSGVSVLNQQFEDFWNDMLFSSDGLLLMYTDNNDMTAVSLGTAWDLDTIDVTSRRTFNTFYVDQNSNRTRFNNDGTKLYIIHGNIVFEYDLQVAYDITSLTFTDGQSLDLVPVIGSSWFGLEFKPDGTKMYVMRSSSTDAIYQFTLSTPWDITTATYDTVSFDLSSQDTTPWDMEISPDGTRLFILGRQWERVWSYTMTAWDLSTLSYDSKFLDHIGVTNNAYSLSINSAGTKMFISALSPLKRIHEYTLSTPWDVDSASLTKSHLGYYTSSDPESVALSADDSKMYVGGFLDDEQFGGIVEYDISETEFCLHTPRYPSPERTFAVSWSTASPTFAGSHFVYDLISPNGVSFYAAIGDGSNGGMRYSSRGTGNTWQQYYGSPTPIYEMSALGYDVETDRLMVGDAGGRFHVQSAAYFVPQENTAITPTGDNTGNRIVSVQKHKCMWIGVAEDATVFISQDDGTTWTQTYRLGGAASTNSKVVFDGTTMTFVALKDGGTLLTLCQSTDGINWTDTDIGSVVNTCRDIDYDISTGVYKICGDNRYVYSSTDLASFTPMQVGTASPATNLYKIKFDPIYAGWLTGGDQNATAYQSNDGGATWAQNSLAAGGIIAGFCAGADANPTPTQHGIYAACAGTGAVLLNESTYP